MEGFAKLARSVSSNMHNMIVIPMSKVLTAQNLGGRFMQNASFITEIIAQNYATSIIQSVSEGIGEATGVGTIPLEALVAEAMFLTGNYDWYKFMLNPETLRTSHTKLQNEEETSDLTIINTYRNKASTMAFTGISGCTIPRTVLQVSGSEFKLPTETFATYPKLSAAWIKFRQLERFYKEINEDIAILFDMDLHVGKFTNFNFTQDAKNPWVINYDFTLKVYPGLSLYSALTATPVTSIDYQMFFDALSQRYGRTWSEDFEGKSKKRTDVLGAVVSSVGGAVR